MPRPANPQLPGLLLDASLALLNERGSTAFSMRELAARVGYAVTAVYRCYETRADLLRHLALRLLGDLQAELGRALDGGPLDRGALAAHLADLGEAYLRWAVSHPAWYAFVFSGEAHGFDADETRRARAGMHWMAELLARHGVGDDPADREALATLLMAALHGLASLALSGRLHGTEAQDPASFFANHAPAWLAKAFGGRPREGGEGALEPAPLRQ